VPWNLPRPHASCLNHVTLRLPVSFQGMYEQHEDTSKRRSSLIKEYESLHVGSGCELQPSGPSTRLVYCGALASLTTELPPGASLEL